MKRNRRRDRPTDIEVEQSFFKMDRIPHYSQDTIRKLKMGRDSIKTGSKPDEVCIRLFGYLNQDLLVLLLNDTEIK